MEWDVSHTLIFSVPDLTLYVLFILIGMGTLHAWESFGDGASPDIQAVAKGLGGGYVKDSLTLSHSIHSLSSTPDMYPLVPF